jgi:hypothetical protein
MPMPKSFYRKCKDMGWDLQHVRCRIPHPLAAFPTHGSGLPSPSQYVAWFNHPPISLLVADGLSGYGRTREAACEDLWRKLFKCGAIKEAADAQGGAEAS